MKFAKLRVYLLCLFLLSGNVFAQVKSLPNGQDLPNDARLKPLKDFNGYFPFIPATDKEQWSRRSQKVKEQLLVANGLWPMPTKTPLNAEIHGLVDYGDYTIEKVYFESLPGFYLTGNLYRPKGKKGKLPTVVSPHGHAVNGRFMDEGLKQAQHLVEIGAEFSVQSARSKIQSRCVHLARMGYIVFHYDMIGYADNTQISFKLAHEFGKQRPEMNTVKNWGLFSPQAESHLQSVFGLQTYNSMRAVDFVLTLDDVDPDRIAVTGSSGGGTQSMMLAALDSRLCASMPVVMVSTSMQGGCTCENASLIRIDTGNVEFSALFAPKPQGLTTADDWTRELAAKGFPELQKHYEMMGAKENIILAGEVRFKHNYNAVSRLAMYKLFNKHMGVDADVKEREYKFLTKNELTVWNDKHPGPEADENFERKLLSYLHEDWQKTFQKLIPQNSSDINEYRKVIGLGVKTVIGSELPDTKVISFQQTGKDSVKGIERITGLVKNSTNKSELPVVLLKPQNWNGDFVIWVSKDGKKDLLNKTEKLLLEGKAVLGADLLFQGEFLREGEHHDRARKVANPRESASFTHGYNHSLFANRVHDILTVISLAELQGAKRIQLVGVEGSGHWVAAAGSQSGSAVDSMAIDTEGFRFINIKDIYDVNFQPGGAKYGDLPGMISLIAPKKLWVKGEQGKGLDLIQKVYSASGALNKLHPGGGNVIEWLIKN